MLNRSLLHD